MAEEEPAADAPAAADEVQAAEETPAGAAADGKGAQDAAPATPTPAVPAAAAPQVLLPEEVSAMGAYLGVNLEAGEHFLLAVAKEAVVSPVVPPWEELEDDRGNPYFFNHRTRASTRRHPLDAKFLKLVRTYRDSPPEGAQVRCRRGGGQGGGRLRKRLVLLSQFFPTLVSDSSTFSPSEGGKKDARARPPIRRLFTESFLSSFLPPPLARSTATTSLLLTRIIQPHSTPTPPAPFSPGSHVDGIHKGARGEVLVQLCGGGAVGGRWGRERRGGGGA